LEDPLGRLEGVPRPVFPDSSAVKQKKQGVNQAVGLKDEPQTDHDQIAGSVCPYPSTILKIFEYVVYYFKNDKVMA